MCKLFAVTGSLSRKTQLAVIEAVNDKFASSQRDGFGFVAYQPHGDVATGHYLVPGSYAGHGVQLPAFLSPGVEAGQLTGGTHLVMHGRTSTGTVSQANVHPFSNGGLHLAHNGHLHYAGPGLTPHSSAGCDSEQLLSWFAGGGQWQGTRDAWGGYGAVMLLDSRTGNLAVAREGAARLSIARRAKGTGWVLATDGDDMVSCCRVAGIGLAHRPISLPQRVVYFGPDGGYVSDEPWAGFGSRQWSRADGIALGDWQGSDWQPGSNRTPPSAGTPGPNGYTAPRTPQAIAEASREQAPLSRRAAKRLAREHKQARLIEVLGDGVSDWQPGINHGPAAGKGGVK